MNDFQAVSERLDILSLIRELSGLELKKMGSWWGLGKNEECPFPGCSSNSGFRVKPETQTCNCFSCDRGGNAVAFIKEHENLDWFGALQLAAEKAGYELQKDAKPVSETYQTKLDIFNAAAEFYHQTLLNSPDAIKILADTRKYDVDDISAWKIGYTGDKPNLLKAHLLRNFPEDQLIASGLLKLRDGKTHSSDYFISKLFIFPHYLHKNCCDFTIKDSLKHQKKKDEVIDYRLPAAKRLNGVLFFNQGGIYHDEVFIVEGEHDAIQLAKALSAEKENVDKPKKHKSPRKNVICINGQLSDLQLEFLKKTVNGKTVYLVYDLDIAGQKYTFKTFNAIYGECVLRVLDFKKKGWDIDKYLRMSNDARMAGIHLLKKAKDAFRYLLEITKEFEDHGRQVDEIMPLVEKIAGLKKETLVTVALENIKDRFENPAIFRIVEKHIKKKQQAIKSSQQADLPIFKEDGIYKYKFPNGQVLRISNFRVELRERIFQNGEFRYKCNLINDFNDYAEVHFEPGDRSNIGAFKRIVNAAGNYYFHGRPETLSIMWEYVDRNQAGDRSIYVQAAGYVDEQKLWLFKNGAIKDGKAYVADEETELVNIDGTNYKIDGVNVYGGDLPVVNFKDDYSKEFSSEIAGKFNDLLDKEYAGMLLLGFLPATLYSDRIIKNFGAFPYLFFYGLPGTGKSASMSLLMKLFGFTGAAEPFSDQTPPGWYQAMGQLSNFPFWTTEFDNAKFKGFESTFKSAYHRNTPGKGDPKRKRLNYKVSATSWIDSNHMIENDAMLERIVCFSLFKKPTGNKKRIEAYKWLHENESKLTVLMRQLILERNPDAIARMRQEITAVRDKMVATGFDVRTALNYAIPAGALRMTDVEIPNAFDDWVMNFAQTNMDYNEKSDPVVSFFSRMSYLYMNGELQNAVAFRRTCKKRDKETVFGDFLYLNVKHIFLNILADYRQKGQEPSYAAQYIRDALCNSDYFVEKNKNERIYNRQNNCIVLDISRIPDNLKMELGPVRDRWGSGDKKELGIIPADVAEMETPLQGEMF